LPLFFSYLKAVIGLWPHFNHFSKWDLESMVLSGNQLSIIGGYGTGDVFIDRSLPGHFTMGCVNDNIMGHGTRSAPEPAGFWLIGSGLFG